MRSLSSELVKNLAIDPAKVRRPKRVAKHLRAMVDLEAKILAEEAATAAGQSEAKQ